MTESGDRQRARLVLAHVPYLDAAQYRRLAGEAGDAGAVRRAGLAQAQVEALRHPDEAALDAAADWLARPGHHLITLDDEAYPSLLARIPDPPPVLWVRGDPDLLWRAQLAVVGSRNPTPGGRDNAREFCRHFAASGLVVTSGLATGIDGAAHAAALDAGGATIAVTATGLDRVYPARHRELARRIEEGGALVSEFPLGTEPLRQHFPLRNRLISGLSLGVLVVEAAHRSGTLITARHAVEQGREVFAIPGSIHNPLAKGCHRLIRQGAKLVETAADVLEELAPMARELGDEIRQRLESGSSQHNSKESAQLDPEQQRVLEAVDWDPTPVDEVVERTGLTPEVVSSMLLMLELEGFVTAASGGRYARTRASQRY